MEASPKLVHQRPPALTLGRLFAIFNDFVEVPRCSIECSSGGTFSCEVFANESIAVVIGQHSAEAIRQRRTPYPANDFVMCVFALPRSACQCSGNAGISNFIINQIQISMKNGPSAAIIFMKVSGIGTLRPNTLTLLS
jgi:hypothetical protein